MASPRISVVIPAYNEEAFLPRCLDSLKKQTFRDFEIIVVAGGQDATATIARKFEAVVIPQTEKGIAAARQKGFDIASGEIIASTDADTVVPENWLERIDELFRQHAEAGAVAGHFQLYDGPAFVRFWIRTSLTLMPVVLKFAPGIWSFGGFNFAVKKDVFKKIGGFDLHRDFGEDVDLCRRLKKNGKVVFDRTLVVRVSGRAFLKDRFGLKNLANYLSVLFRGKPSLTVVHGSDIINKPGNLE
ncbi:MAG: glycosyltransferase family A protein [Dehalococcoidales bacterium]|nr:glycosyltransferase family A protein [Dehalococcoidales bacterium]